MRPPTNRPGLDFLTVSEVAAELRVSKMSVYRLIRGRTLPAIRIGRLLRVPESALDAYIREQYGEGEEE